MSYSLATAVDENLQVTALELMSEVEIRNSEWIFVEDPTTDPQYTRLREQGFTARILNLTGQTVQAYGPYSDLPQPHIDLTIPNHAGPFTTISSPGSRDLVRVYTASLIKDAQTVGTLQVAHHLNEVQATLNLLLITLLLAGPTLVIVAGCSGYFLAARILAPIDKITHTARQISAKDLAARLNLPETDDEVGRLAATFDSMLARLDDAFRRERQFTVDASHELRTRPSTHASTR